MPWWGRRFLSEELGVYDEAKRYAESITMAYHRHHRLDTRIARIFSTTRAHRAPRRRAHDPELRPARVLGGAAKHPRRRGQTWSVQYADNPIEGVFYPIHSREVRLVNIDDAVEYSVKEVAELILSLSSSRSPRLIYNPLPEDDPKRCCPDITAPRRLRTGSRWSAPKRARADPRTVRPAYTAAAGSVALMPAASGLAPKLRAPTSRGGSFGTELPPLVPILDFFGQNRRLPRSPRQTPRTSPKFAGHCVLSKWWFRPVLVDWS
jgi:hypothetical protein